MDNLPQFKGFGQRDDDKQKTFRMWAMIIGGGLLLFLLGIGAAKVLFYGGGRGGSGQAGNGLTAPYIFGRDNGPKDVEKAAAGAGDSLSMIRQDGINLYNHTAAGAANQQAQNGQDGQGGAGGADGAAGAGGAGGADGAGQGAGQGGSGPLNGGAGLQGGGLAHLNTGGMHAYGAGSASMQTGAFMAGGNYYGHGNGNGTFNGAGGGRLVAAPRAGHKVVGAQGSGEALGRRLSSNMGGFGTARTLGTGATTVSNPPPPPAPVATVAGGGTNTGGAGDGSNGGGPPPADQGGGSQAGGPTGTGSGDGGGGGTTTTTTTKKTPKCKVLPACFIAGTHVLTPEGPRSIETIKVGELIYAVDPNTYELVARPVVQAHHHPPGPLYRLSFSNGLTLTTTAEHRFYDPAKRDYRHASEMKPGDRVVQLEPASESVGLLTPAAPPTRLMPDDLMLQASGTAGRVASVARELTVTVSQPLHESAPTFNLTVEGNDLSNYLAEGVLVHNHKCYPGEACYQPPEDVCSP